MKSFSFLLFIVLMAFEIGCKPALKDKNVPAGMIQAFHSRYPEAKNIKWKNADSGKFIAHFSLKNKDFTTFYSSVGKWILTENKIKSRELPATVRNTIENGFDDYSLKSLRQIESASLGNYYSVELKRGLEQIELKLSHDGVILNFNDLKRDKN